jgi:non-heme chloroperoxidase
MLRRSLVLWAVACTLGACQVEPVAPSPPGEVKHVQVNGVDLAYVDQGRGVPVVFVHGSVGDRRIWRHQRAAIVSHGYRFIAYSRRYHWPNKGPTEGVAYSVEMHATDLEAFIRALDAGPVHLVSTSYGAQVATLVTLEHPELVRSLTVNEPGFAQLVVGTPQGKAAAVAFGKSLAPVRAAAKEGRFLAAAQLLIDAAMGEPGAASTLPQEERAILQANAATIGPQVNSRARPDISCVRLSKLQTPVLVVGGDASPRFFAMTNEAMANCLPNTTRVVVPNARHLTHSMNPDFYNHALLAFLSGH